MSVAQWDEPLAPQERDALLDRMADEVAKRGLTTPALFALEIHRPFAFMASQGLILGGGLLAPLLGLERVQNLSRLLREPGAVESLIQRIEERQSGAPVGGEETK